MDYLPLKILQLICKSVSKKTELSRQRLILHPSDMSCQQMVLLCVCVCVPFCQRLNQCQDSLQHRLTLKALLILNPSTCMCCRDIQMRHDNTHDLQGSVSSWICHTSKSPKLNFSPITI